MKINRPMEWAYPVPAVRREVVTARPEHDEGRPPILFVPGFGHGAWAFTEHWLEHTAARGFAASAMSLRGHGGSAAARKTGLRAYTHDVVQVAASLPRQAVLVGHGASALVVARALARYPARAGVLLSPALGGFRGVGAFRAALGRPGRRLLFSRELTTTVGDGLAGRLGRAAPRAVLGFLLRRDPEPPVGDPPMLVVGSPDDRIVSRTALDRAARRYGGAPLLFDGMGHDVMLDARWREPIDAILDWLEKVTPR